MNTHTSNRGGMINSSPALSLCDDGSTQAWRMSHKLCSPGFFVGKKMMELKNEKVEGRMSCRLSICILVEFVK